MNVRLKMLNYYILKNDLVLNEHLFDDMLYSYKLMTYVKLQRNDTFSFIMKRAFKMLFVKTFHSVI